MNSHRSAAAPRTRRQVVGAGLAGMASSLGVTQFASAHSPQSVPTPPSDDQEAREVLGFALSVELAARDLYYAAVAEREDVDPLNVFQVIGDNHDAYADMLAGELGIAARGNRDDEFFDGWEPEFTSTDDVAVAATAYTVESQLLATYTESLGSLGSAAAAERLAAILVGEARHCAVLADVSQRSSDMGVLLDNDAAPLATSTDVEVSG